MALSLEYGLESDIGRTRKKNEDYHGTFTSPFGEVFLVCDGMGGHNGGATASRLAVETFEQVCKTEQFATPKEALEIAFSKANTAIFRLAQTNELLTGMGTTCVVAVLSDTGLLYYAHMGDSRLYLFRKGKLQRLTKDHSYVQTLVDQGLLKEVDIEKHPRKNEITRALGVREEMEPEICVEPLSLQIGDKLLLCSDGLTSMLSDSNIQSVLTEPLPTKSQAVKLIELANEAGGIDNITVQLIHIQNIETTPSSSIRNNSVDIDFVKHWIVQNKFLLIGILAFFLILVAYCQFSGNAPSDSLSDSSETLEESSRNKSNANKTSQEPETQSNSNTDEENPDINTETNKTVQTDKIDKSDKYTITYTVKKGETLSKISIRYNVSKAKIRELNHLKSDQVNAEQKIKIPIRTIHKVKKDEVLSKICEKYKVKQEKLIEINNFRKNKDKEPVIKEGDRIVIPL